MSDLENIKVGDWVKIQKGRQTSVMTQVTGVSETRFKASGYSFRKKDGLSSQTWLEGSFVRHRAFLATEEDRRKDLMILDLINWLQTDTGRFPANLIEDWHKLLSEQTTQQ